MAFGVNPASQGGYLAGVLLFLLAWFVTLGGLIASQVYCYNPEGDIINANPGATVMFLSGGLNRACSDTFTMPWFVWALCFLPAIIALSTAFAPTYLRGSTTTLFAVVTVLNILMTHAFHELRHISKDINLDKKYHRAITATLVGFALMSAFGLLMLLLDGLLSFNKKNRSHHEGGVAHTTEPKYTHTHTTTVPANTHVSNV